MLSKLFKLLGGEAALSKKLGSLLRHLIPVITTYLVSLNLPPELVSQLAGHLDALFVVLGSVIVSVVMSFREKVGK